AQHLAIGGRVPERLAAFVEGEDFATAARDDDGRPVDTDARAQTFLDALLPDHGAGGCRKPGECAIGGRDEDVVAKNAGREEGTLALTDRYGPKLLDVDARLDRRQFDGLARVIAAEQGTQPGAAR